MITVWQLPNFKLRILLLQWCRGANLQKKTGNGTSSGLVCLGSTIYQAYYTDCNGTVPLQSGINLCDHKS